MHTLEDLVGGLTIAELAQKAGITVATLVDRVTPRATRIVEPSTPTRSVALPSLPADPLKIEWVEPEIPKKAKALPKPKVQPSVVDTEQLDVLVLKFLMTTNASVKANAVLEDVDPSGTRVTAIDVRNSLNRLHAQGKVTYTGNTRGRTYSLVRKKGKN